MPSVPEMENRMNVVQGPANFLSEDSLDQICGGRYPFRPQAGPVYDYSVNPKSMGALMGAGAVTGGLGGMAVCATSDLSRGKVGPS